MPEVTLKFNLPEESEEFETSVNGQKYRDTLNDLRDYIRNKRKHSDDTSTTWDEVFTVFWDAVKDNNIEL